MFLDISFGYVILLVLLAAVSITSIAFRFPAGRTVAALLLAVYVAALLTTKLLPMPLTHEPPFGADLAPYPTPFAYLGAAWEIYSSSGRGADFVAIVIRMVLEYVPLGLLLPLVLDSPDERLDVRAASLVVIAPVCIELAQLLECAWAGAFYKRIATDDVLLAVLGGLAGYALFRAVGLFVTRLRRRRATLM